MIKKILKKWKAKRKQCKRCMMIEQLLRPGQKKDIQNYLQNINKKAIITLLVIIANQFLFMKMIADAGELNSASLLECTNGMRAEYNLGPLYLNQDLTYAANKKLEDMEFYKYWAHENPETGKKPWDFVDESGYYYQTTGENLAIGFIDSEEVCDAWANSQVHLANIVNKSYQEVGFAVHKADLEDHGKGLLVVQMFGSRKDFSPPKDPYFVNNDTNTDQSTEINSDSSVGEGSVKGVNIVNSQDNLDKTDNDNPLVKLWNILISNIMLFVFIAAYFVIRSVIMCKHEHGGVIHPRCVIVLITFLIIASCSVIAFYFSNISLV